MSNSGRSPSRPTPAVAGDRAAGDSAAVSPASVTAPDGLVIATVSRRVRLGGPGEPGSEVVVTVQGDLDLDTAPLAQAALIQALDGARRVCLDLAGVTFFGAAGVRVVIAGRRHAASRGRTLRLSGVHGITERVLDITGLYPQD